MSAELREDLALIEAGVLASKFLELGRDDLATVTRCVPAVVLTLAILMTQTDSEFVPRWQAAGTDWVAQGEVLRDALLFILTPDPRLWTDA